MFDASKVLCMLSGSVIACSLARNLLQRSQCHYILRIIKEYFQPKIGRKIIILQPGPEKLYSCTLAWKIKLDLRSVILTLFESS